MSRPSQKGIVFLPLMILAVVVVTAGGVIGVKSGLLKLTASPSGVGSPINVFNRAPVKSTPSPTPASFEFSNLEQSGQEINNLPADSSVSPESLTFVNYSSSEYGYFLSHPLGWSVENVPSKTHREIKVKDPKGVAFVLIAAHIDPNISSTTDLEGAISSRESAIKSSVNVDNFEKSVQGEVGGYLATGSETFNGITVNFQERGLFGTTGKILLFHGAVVPEYMNNYGAAITQIIDSFKLE